MRSVMEVRCSRAGKGMISFGAAELLSGENAMMPAVPSVTSFRTILSSLIYTPRGKFFN